MLLIFRMYTRYAERTNWSTELLSVNETELGGFKEIIFMVVGKGAFSRLKYESGVHRYSGFLQPKLAAGSTPLLP